MDKEEEKILLCYSDAGQVDNFNLELTAGYQMGYVLYSSISDFNSREAAVPPPLDQEEQDEPLFGEHLREAIDVVKGIFK